MKENSAARYSTILETRRLILRKLEPADAPILARLWSDPRVTEYEGGPREFAQIEKSLVEDARSGQPNPFDMWACVEKETKQVIGHCGLIEKEVEGRKEIEVTYTLAQNTWGKGYATEIAGALRDFAITKLRVTRLIALIHPGNVASARVAEKIGMRFEREVVRPSGAVRKIYIWEANQ